MPRRQGNADMSRKSIAAWMTLVLATTGSASADVIFEQLPMQTGGGAGDLDFYTDSGIRSWQQTADDFVLPGKAVIDSVGWFGFYGGDFSGSVSPPAGPEVMRMRIYSPRPTDGLPGSVLYEETFIDPPRRPTGLNVILYGNHPEYRYAAELATPFPANSNTSYWLEIVQVDDVESHFRWETSAGNGTPYAFLNPNVPDWHWTTSTANRAFVLGSIPEPSTLLLSVVGLIVAVREGRRSRRRL